MTSRTYLWLVTFLGCPTGPFGRFRNRIIQVSRYLISDLMLHSKLTANLINHSFNNFYILTRSHKNLNLIHAWNSEYIIWASLNSFLDSTRLVDWPRFRNVPLLLLTNSFFLVFELLVFKSCWYVYPFSVRERFLDSSVSSSSASLAWASALASLSTDMTASRRSLNDCYCGWPPVVHDEKRCDKITERPKLCLFTGQVQHMPSTCEFESCVFKQNMWLLAITKAWNLARNTLKECSVQCFFNNSYRSGR